jgi:hypothetical protein
MGAVKAPFIWLSDALCTNGGYACSWKHPVMDESLHWRS